MQRGHAQSLVRSVNDAPSHTIAHFCLINNNYYIHRFFFQPTIRENPLTASTDSLGKLAGLSPSVSLGEPLQEQTDGGTAKTQWDMEKQQISTEMGILREQLQTETSSRIEAQVSCCVQL